MRGKKRKNLASLLPLAGGGSVSFWDDWQGICRIWSHVTNNCDFERCHVAGRG